MRAATESGARPVGISGATPTIVRVAKSLAVSDLRHELDGLDTQLTDRLRRDERERSRCETLPSGQRRDPVSGLCWRAKYRVEADRSGERPVSEVDDCELK